ncbi:hypothetical protein [Cerasicoccus arenae]|uniref:hypothetical protein n=1 Tax=Cerasicoccus arenae TaxID=424488 RepID=UPI00167442CB|nr:hypothetical protein [Cerasicoccus arenae]MBK1857641.1 hypothetical protein [Cerasicoccus arenae]
MKTPNEPNTRRLSLWIPVTIAFLVLIAAWTTLIVIAAKHPTEIVPVEQAAD